MKLLLQSLGAIALVLLIFCLGVTSYILWQVGPHAKQLVTDADRVLWIVGGAATNVEKASATWEQASREQASQTTLAMSNVSVAVAKFSTFVSRTDNSLNSMFIPALTDLVTSQSAALLVSQNSFQSNLKDITLATQQLQKTLADADAQISNPAIGQAVDHLATAAKNVDEGTGQGVAIVTKVRLGVDKEVDALLAPVNKAKAAALFIAQLLGRLYGF